MRALLVLVALLAASTAVAGDGECVYQNGSTVEVTLSECTDAPVVQDLLDVLCPFVTVCEDILG